MGACTIESCCGSRTDQTMPLKRAFIRLLLFAGALGSASVGAQTRELAQSDRSPSAILDELQTRLRDSVSDTCTVDRSSAGTEGDSLDVVCRLTAFRVGGFCDRDVGGKTLGDMIRSSEVVLFHLLSVSPVGRVLDFEIELTGWSDGLDFENRSSSFDFKCGGYDDQIDTWLSGRDISLHHRLGLYRGFLVWSDLLGVTDQLSMPLGTPTLDESVLGTSPGRVMLRSQRTSQIGPEFRKVEVRFKVYPKLYLRCAGTTRPVLSNGVEACLPACSPETHLREVGGVLSCVPDCSQDEFLEFGAEEGFRCVPHLCPECQGSSTPSDSSPRPSLAIYVDQAATIVGAFPTRLMAGLLVRGRSLDVYALLGGVMDGVDQSWGLTALGGLRFPVGQSKAWFPRVDLSFTNLSETWGNDEWSPRWLISVDLGVDWEFFRRDHFAMAAALSVPVGMALEDKHYGNGAATRSEVGVDFLIGGCLGLRLFF